MAVLCIAALATPAAAQAPLKVGEHIPIRIALQGDSDVEGVPTDQGRVFRLTEPGATYIALHFQEFDLAPGAVLRISDGRGGQRYQLQGRGKMEAGTFWSQHVKGDTVLLRLTGGGAEPGRFVVDEMTAGFVNLGYAPEAICGTDDKQNAICYETSHPTEYDRSRAVARLLIQGAFLCTGWLASANDHFITNEHCITSSTDALNTDYEFMAEAPNCGSTNCQLCWTGDIISGGTFLKDSVALDYSLVQLGSGSLAATYGYLQIDDRPAVVGEEIYIPQHAAGYAKELGIASSSASDSGGVCHVNTFSAPCSGSGYQDVGYQCDTEGGSSGSPVLARSSHKVIALHHCAACPNRGVPIELVCDEICSLLGPECVVDGDCDDGDACTTDTCNGGSCDHTPLASCCGNGTCENGEDCNSCAADCPSGGGGSPGVCGNGVCEPTFGEDCVSCAGDCNGKTGGKPSNRYCCGDGDGPNPVDCADARCTSSGYQCGTVSGGGTCCGDFTCEGDEDCATCAVDCQTSTTEVNYCADGLDNDCDGPADCSDGDCTGDPACDTPSCGAKNDTCSTGADCCSGTCKANGRCR